ncbi:MAG: putative esterase [Verrucomicrobiales bacterium]|nr:putative esterase [Verrucomicrobiales bacterium]
MNRKHFALALSAAMAATFTVIGAEPAPAPTPTVTPTAGAAPSTAPAAAPAAGRSGGARGGPVVVIAPLASAETVELVPPLGKPGNFKHAPKTTWKDVPGITVKEGTPRGTVTMFRVPGADSKLFPGNYQRNVWVYVPAGYKEGTELPFMLDHDGSANAVVQTQLIATMDNFIAQKKIPVMAGIFVAPASRSVEYDTVSGKYCEYLENEILPLVEQNAKIKLTKDPEGRGTIGQSSGAAAAFTMAWFHPELYRRVISYSGSFTRLQRNATYPQGAWEYHQTIIPMSERKPIRIWMQVGSEDLNNQFGDWRVANNNMADALKAKGYEYQYLWSEGARHVEGGVERQTMEEAMEWVWKTYKPR